MVIMVVMIRKKTGAFEVRSICTGLLPGTTPQASLGNGGKGASFDSGDGRGLACITLGQSPGPG